MLVKSSAGRFFFQQLIKYTHISFLTFLRYVKVLDENGGANIDATNASLFVSLRGMLNNHNENSPLWLASIFLLKKFSIICRFPYICPVYDKLRTSEKFSSICRLPSIIPIYDAFWALQIFSIVCRLSSVILVYDKFWTRDILL